MFAKERLFGSVFVLEECRMREKERGTEREGQIEGERERERMIERDRERERIKKRER